MKFHVGIAGAGLLGRLLAYQLARRGCRVDVFDLAASGVRRASSSQLAAGWTAAGMLRPVAELDRGDSTILDLGLRSIKLWSQIFAQLNQPVEFHNKGCLLLAHRQDAGVAMRLMDAITAKAPMHYYPQPLSSQELKRLEPFLAAVAHAWFMPEAGSLDNEAAMDALYSSATELGVTWHWECDVSHVYKGKLLWKSGHVNDAVQTHSFDHVFDVRGVGAKTDLNVRGVRGEIFLLHAPDVYLSRPVSLVTPRISMYITPRANHHVLVGASEIESEDRSDVSVKSTLELLSCAYSVLPGLAEARILRSESNLRPAMPDNQPLLMQDSSLTRINGLYRHGWLIAPALVEDAIRGICS